MNYSEFDIRMWLEKKFRSHYVPFVYCKYAFDIIRNDKGIDHALFGHSGDSLVLRQWQHRSKLDNFLLTIEKDRLKPNDICVFTLFSEVVYYINGYNTKYESIGIASVPLWDNVTQEYNVKRRKKTIEYN